VAWSDFVAVDHPNFRRLDRWTLAAAREIVSGTGHVKSAFGERQRPSYRAIDTQATVIDDRALEPFGARTWNREFFDMSSPRTEARNAF
jgi:hypothetical protein